MRVTQKLAALTAATALALGGVVAAGVATAPIAAANECSRDGNYGEFITDDAKPVTKCDSAPAPKPAPKPDPAPVVKPPPPPAKKPAAQPAPAPVKKPVAKPAPAPVKKPAAKPAPKPVPAPKPAPAPVKKLAAKPAPAPVSVRQDAKPPAKISATAEKVCVIKVTVKNSGGTAAQVHVADQVLDLAPGAQKVVEVPVAPDGKWSIKVTGPGYEEVFSGGCDCTEQLPQQPTAEVMQDAVPNVDYQFPWLVVIGAAALSSVGTVFAMKRRTAKS